MGYNTVALFLNDAWHQIENDSAKVLKDIRHESVLPENNGDIQVGNHANAIKVLQTFHADNEKILIAGGNDIIDFESNKFIQSLYNSNSYRQNMQVVIKRMNSYMDLLNKAMKLWDTLKQGDKIKYSGQIYMFQNFDNDNPTTLHCIDANNNSIMINASVNNLKKI